MTVSSVIEFSIQICCLDSGYHQKHMSAIMKEVFILYRVKKRKNTFRDQQ